MNKTAQFIREYLKQAAIKVNLNKPEPGVVGKALSRARNFVFPATSKLSPEESASMKSLLEFQVQQSRAKALANQLPKVSPALDNLLLSLGR